MPYVPDQAMLGGSSLNIQGGGSAPPAVNPQAQAGAPATAQGIQQAQGQEPQAQPPAQQGQAPMQAQPTPPQQAPAPVGPQPFRLSGNPFAPQLAQQVPSGAEMVSQMPKAAAKFDWGKKRKKNKRKEPRPGKTVFMRKRSSIGLLSGGMHANQPTFSGVTISGLKAAQQGAGAGAEHTHTANPGIALTTESGAANAYPAALIALAREHVKNGGVLKQADAMDGVNTFTGAALGSQLHRLGPPLQHTMMAQQPLKNLMLTTMRGNPQRKILGLLGALFGGGAGYGLSRLSKQGGVLKMFNMERSGTGQGSKKPKVMPNWTREGKDAFLDPSEMYHSGGRKRRRDKTGGALQDAVSLRASTSQSDAMSGHVPVRNTHAQNLIDSASRLRDRVKGNSQYQRPMPGGGSFAPGALKRAFELSPYAAIPLAGAGVGAAFGGATAGKGNRTRGLIRGAGGGLGAVLGGGAGLLAGLYGAGKLEGTHPNLAQLLAPAATFAGGHLGMLGGSALAGKVAPDEEEDMIADGKYASVRDVLNDRSLNAMEKQAIIGALLGTGLRGLGLAARAGGGLLRGAGAVGRGAGAATSMLGKGVSGAGNMLARGGKAVTGDASSMLRSTLGTGMQAAGAVPQAVGGLLRGGGAAMSGLGAGASMLGRGAGAAGRMATGVGTQLQANGLRGTLAGAGRSLMGKAKSTLSGQGPAAARPSPAAMPKPADTAAWANFGQPALAKAGSFDDLEPFALAFLDRCLEKGLNANQIKHAAVKASQVHEDVAAALEPLTKEAIIGALRAGATALMPHLGRVGAGLSRAGTAVSGAGTKAMGAVQGVGSQIATKAPGLTNIAKSVGTGAKNMAGGTLQGGAMGAGIDAVGDLTGAYDTGGMGMMLGAGMGGLARAPGITNMITRGSGAMSKLTHPIAAKLAPGATKAQQFFTGGGMGNSAMGGALGKVNRGLTTTGLIAAPIAMGRREGISAAHGELENMAQQHGMTGDEMLNLAGMFNNGDYMGLLRHGWGKLDPAAKNMIMGGLGVGALGLGATAMGHGGLGAAGMAGGLGLLGAGLYQGGNRSGLFGPQNASTPYQQAQVNQQAALPQEPAPAQAAAGAGAQPALERRNELQLQTG